MSLEKGDLGLIVVFFFVSTLTPHLGTYFLVWHQMHFEYDASLTPHF